MLKSLCCMRLNTAGIVFGWLGIIGSFVLTILVSTILGYADVIAEQFVKENKGMNVDEVHTAIVVVCGVYLAITILNLMASALLVLGTMKERHLMLLPWLINSGISLVFSAIYSLVSLIAVLSNGSPGEAIPMFILPLIVLGIQTYIYYGIYSLYKHIQLSRDQQQPLMAQAQGMPVPAQGNTYPSYTKI